MAHDGSTTEPSISPADNRFIQWWREAHAYQSDWRVRNELNYSYYDGDQYTDAENTALERRGQQATVLNICRQTIDMIMAMEAQRRVEVNIAPREVSDEPMAEVLNGLLKQVSDVASRPYEEAQGFRQALTGGLGVMEVYPYQDDNNEWQIDVSQEPWEDFYVDPFSRKPDWSDARYVIKRVWMPLENARARWPKMADMVDQLWQQHLDISEETFAGQENAAQTAAQTESSVSSFDVKNRRIAIHEVYYSLPVGTSRKRRKIHHVIHTDQIFFKGDPDDDSLNTFPYRGANIYPYIPIIALTKRDGTYQGVVDLIRSIQDSVNKLNSKDIWNMSSNQIIMEEGATDDPEQARRQAARPDGVITVSDGSLQAGRFQMRDNLRESANLHGREQALLGHAQRITGVNDATLGLGGTNARTASQESSRLLQGAALQTSLLENFFMAKRRTTEVVLRMIGAFFTDKRIARVQLPNGADDFVELNTEPFNKIGDILRFDVVLREVPTFTTVRQENLKAITEVAKANILPLEIAGKAILELMELPNKRQLIQEFEQLVAGANQQPGGPGAVPPTA